MVYVGNGRAEQRKDAIARILDHVALIAMHGVHHELYSGIDKGARLFGIEVFDEPHRVLDVSKESSNGLALPVCGPSGFHRCLLGTDTFDEMFGCVANGGRGLGESGVRSLESAV